MNLPNPQPTSGTPYDSYVWPRSKTPALDALYARLHDLGWRYDPASVTFHTPEGDVLQAFGRLEYDPAYTKASIQPPSIPVEDDRRWVRPEPILTLTRTGDVWSVA